MNKERLKQQQLTNQNKIYFEDTGKNTANSTTSFGATEGRDTIIAT